MRTPSLLALATALPLACSTPEPAVDTPGAVADLVLRNAKIVTLSSSGSPVVEALAVRDGRILAVGRNDQIAAFLGAGTRVLDLRGALAIPGFIEGHGHFLGIGDRSLQLDLASVATWDEIVAMVADAVGEAGSGELVRGRGWHQSKWDRSPSPAVLGLPTHHGLSAVSPDHPVVLRHASGHASFANAKAMELSGITRDTPDPAGGEIVHDDSGEPIGVFRETAQSLLAPAYAHATPPDPRRMAELARDECLRKGITSFQDAGSSFEDVELFRELAESGELGLRLWVMLRESNARLARGLEGYPLVGLGDEHLTVGGLKVSIDGALGPHGAWLLAPYSDLPESEGLNTVTLESLETTAELALEHGLQLCVHAIGDRANREVLDVFEAAFDTRGGGRDLRWRIEHAQHLSPADIPRFAALGVIASMQGVHCTSDAAFVVERLGERRAREGAYVWRTLLESGAVVTNGTDAPVEDVDPLASYYSTVTRMAKSGEPFFPDQRLSREEALRTYTAACAYAAFEEESKGRLEPGKLADLTVLSRDILTIPAEEILETSVLYTIVGGKVLYAAER